MLHHTGLLAPLESSILATILLNPDDAYYRGRIARELAVPTSSLQRPLARLAETGIVRTHLKGKRIHYQANRNHPVYPELCALLARLSGPDAMMRQALAPHASEVELAFIYGAAATAVAATGRGDARIGDERVRDARAGDRSDDLPDIDLIVVGTADRGALTEALDATAERLGR